MSEWIDVVVYVALTVTLWGSLAAWSASATAAIVTDRNPRWIVEHVHTARSWLGSRGFRWSCLVWSAITIVALVTYQARMWPASLSAVFEAAAPWEALKNLQSALLIAGLAYLAACTLLFFRWLHTTVPLASERRASLDRRSLHQHVRPGLQLAVYGLVLVHLAMWVTLAVMAEPTPALWAGLAFQVGVSGLCLLLVLRVIRRRPGAIDQWFGPRYRTTEIRVAFVAQLLPLLNGGARLYEQVSGGASNDLDRLLHLGLVLLIVILVLAAWFRHAGASPTTGWRHRAGSAGALMVTTLVPGSLLAQAPVRSLTDGDVRALLAARTDVHRHSVGTGVGIVEPSGRRIVTYGFRSRNGGVPVDGDTVFELASVTKAFTSLLLADAVTRGEVALGDPVAKYLPGSVRVPERGGRVITLHDLATHTSGLPREPSNLQAKDPSNPFADYTVEQLYSFLSNYQLTRDIGSGFEYSNVGAGLLGHVLARRAGTDYEGLVRQRITNPLGMSSTAVTLTPAMRARAATGHDIFLEPVRGWDSPTLAGAGALHSTVNDMLTFLEAASGIRPSPLSSAFALMASARRPTPSPTFDVGLGWGIARDRGTEILFVNGRSGGYRTWLGAEPGTRRGVVVLANADGVIGPDDLGRHLLNSAFPLMTTLPTGPTPRAVVNVDPAVLERYVGRYQFAPSAVLTISRQDGRIFAQLTGQPAAEVFPSSEREFFYKAVDAQLTFTTDADGRVTALVLRQNGAEQQARRVD